MAQTLRVEVEQIGATSATAAARSHRVLVDRPIAKGGEDRGPLGGEYLLVALGGCFMSNLLAAVRAREARVSEVRVGVSATMDGLPERFTAFTLDVSVGAGDPDDVRKLIGIAARACAVTNTLRRSAPIALAFAGSPVEVLD
jgi:putative redox protein